MIELNKSILVIGAGGFIGKKLVQKLVSKSYFVVCLGRSEIPVELKIHSEFNRIKWVKGSYADTKLIENLISEVSIVFHLASATLPKSSNDNPIYDAESNLLPTISLISILTSKKIKKFIYASSGGTVYGEQETMPIKENATTNPICAYGIHKLAVEKHIILNIKLNGLSAVIMRISNPYGNGKDLSKNQGIIDSFINNIKLKKEIIIWGDGSVVRDFLHVDDVVDVAYKLIDYNGKEVIFNVGSGKGLSIKDLVKKFKFFSDVDIKINYKEKRNIDLMYNVLDSTLLFREISWKARSNLDDYIKHNFKNNN